MRLKNFSLTFGGQIFRAFSDESRVRILYLLHKNEQMCISDIELVLDYTQTKTSRHLIYLKNAGLVNFRRHDQWVYYFIKDEVFDIVSQIFKYMEKDSLLQTDQDTYQILYSNRELAVNKLHTRKYIADKQ